MNAIIIYDDLACAAKVNAMLARAAGRAEETAHWNVKPWRLDLLDRPPTVGESRRDAADAHLIVIALREPGSLPAGLLDWLETWAAHREVRDAALAVFGGGNSDAPTAPAMPGLLRLAERHGLSFIFDDGGPAGEEPAFFARDRHERESLMTSTPQQFLDDVHPHWGINE